MTEKINVVEENVQQKLSDCCHDKKNIIHDSDLDQDFCTKCGLSQNERGMSRGPEERAFTEEERRRKIRTGSPINYKIHDKGLSTIISGHNKDAYGNLLPASTRMERYNLRKWDRRLKVTPEERNLVRALSELDRLGDKLKIPNYVMEQASKIYRDAMKEKLIRGRSIRTTMVSSLYAACRMHNIPRTLLTFSTEANIRKKDIARTYRFLVRELDLSFPVQGPASYIAKIATKTRASQLAQEKAKEIINKAKEKGLVDGKGPICVAAASLYMACIIYDEHKTQKDIANVAQVTEVTIRNRYKGLLETLGSYFTPEEHEKLKKYAGTLKKSSQFL